MRVLVNMLLLVAFAGSSSAALFTNTASVDSFVRAAAPTLNYGGAGALSVSGADATNSMGATNGAFDSFIRFNTGAMVTNFNSRFGSNNWVINGATLQVTEIGVANNALFNRGVGSFQIRWIANDTWVEGTGTPGLPTTNGITYNDESALLNVATDAVLGTFTNTGVDGVLNFALPLMGPFVNDVAAGGEVGLFLTAIDRGIGFTFDSRSFVTDSTHPVLVISAVPRPSILGIALKGADVVITATNGAAGETCYVLSSTNVARPLSQWTSVATNQLTASGGFICTITNGASNGPAQFFILQTR